MIFIKNTLTTLVLVLFAVNTQAQVSKVIHQTFDLNEETQTVDLDIMADSVEVVTWSSNSIMSVANVELTSGAKHILDFFVKEGRYDLESEALTDSSLKLVSADKVRKGLNWKGQLVYETVKVKLYIPENFEKKGNQLIRKEPSTANK